MLCFVKRVLNSVEAAKSPSRTCWCGYLRFEVNKKSIQLLLEEGSAEEVLKVTQSCLSKGADDEIYYLRGNAFMRLQNWQGAIECYLEALALNPESPARETMQMAEDILNFYNKDIYGQ